MAAIYDQIALIVGRFCFDLNGEYLLELAPAPNRGQLDLRFLAYDNPSIQIWGEAPPVPCLFLPVVDEDKPPRRFLSGGLGLGTEVTIHGPVDGARLRSLCETSAPGVLQAVSIRYGGDDHMAFVVLDPDRLEQMSRGSLYRVDHFLLRTP